MYVYIDDLCATYSLMQKTQASAGGPCLSKWRKREEHQHKNNECRFYPLFNFILPYYKSIYFQLTFNQK